MLFVVCCTGEPKISRNSEQIEDGWKFCFKVPFYSRRPQLNIYSWDILYCIFILPLLEYLPADLGMKCKKKNNFLMHQS